MQSGMIPVSGKETKARDRRKYRAGPGWTHGPGDRIFASMSD